MPPLARQSSLDSVESWWSDRNPPGASISLHAAAKPLMRLMYHRQASKWMKENPDVPLSRESIDLCLSWLVYKYVSASTKTKVLAYIARSGIYEGDAHAVAWSLLMQLEQFLQDPATQRQIYACEVLGLLAVNESSAPVVLQFNLCGRLVSLLHVQNPILTVSALDVLREIADTPNGGQAVVDAGLLSVLDGLLRSTSTIVRTATCKVLSTLTTSESTSDSVIFVNPSSMLVSLLGDEDPQVGDEATRVLASMARWADGAEVVMEAISEENAHQVVYSLLMQSRFLEAADAQMQMHVCDVLVHLGDVLLRRFQRLRDLNALNQSLSILRTAMNLAPISHSDRPGILKDLANCLLCRYEHLCSWSDIDEARLVLREALRDLPADHSVRPSMLRLLGDSLLRRFEHFRDLDDIQEALQVLREAINLSPYIDPNNDLAYCLVCRFGKLGDLKDVQDAVRLFESSTGSSDNSALYQTLKATIPAICCFLHDRDIVQRSTAVGVLTTLVAHPGFHEPLETVVPGLVSLLARENDPDLKYKTALSLERFLRYPSFRNLLVDDIPLLDAQLSPNRQATERTSEPQPLGDDTDDSTGNTTSTSITRSTQDSGSSQSTEEDFPPPSDDTSLIEAEHSRDRQHIQEEEPHHHDTLGTATTVSIGPSTEDSIVRRRRLPTRKQDSDHRHPGFPVPSSFTIPQELRNCLMAVSSHLHLGGASTQPNPTGVHAGWSAWLTLPDMGRWLTKIGNSIGAAYIFIIAPPFLHDRVALWDLQRLETRLGLFHGWVWAANAALFGVSATLLPATGVSNCPVAQSFLILCGIFGLFGFVYTVFLAFRMADCKAQYSSHFIDRANSTQGVRSFWNVAIMLSLPLTWMAWAFVCLLCFMLSLWVQQAILSFGRSDSKIAVDPPTSKGLSIVQLCGFMVAVVWSTSYVFMIHVEIRRCTDSSNSPATSP